MTLPPCQEIEQTMGQLFNCSEVNGFIRIRTPYLYPDGDVIDLFFKDQNGQQILTDMGETLRWLMGQTTNQYLSKKQEQALEDIRLTHSIEIYRGKLVARRTSEESLAEIVSRVSQAALSVSNLWFMFRTRIGNSILDDVAELFREKNIRFEPNEKFPGRSGKSWRVDFHTWHPKHGSLVQVLSTGSTAAANTKTNNTLATWYDLSQHKMGRDPLRFVSLFDDTLDVWREENIRQLEDLSDIAYWSQPKQFLDLLVA